MNCLAWNINNRNSFSDAYYLLKENDGDVLFLIEASNFNYSDFETLDKDNEYKLIRKVYDQNENTSIICISKTSMNVNHVNSDRRYDVFKCSVYTEDYYMFVVHLQSKLSGETRARDLHFDMARRIKEAFEDCKEKYGMKLYCIIGDFNCNPTDDEMYQASGFNAKIFKRVVVKDKTVTYNHEIYELLYNPILYFLDEKTEDYGSYYYKDPLGMFWNQFDQVIFNCELCHYFETGYYVKKVNNKNFVVDGHVNGELSDHIPICVKFKKSEDN